MDEFIILFIVLILYILTLFVVRAMGIGLKEECEICKNCCPDCKKPLKRIKRKDIDHILYLITLKIFGFKRYSCDNCGWEGLRWERSYKG